MADQARSRPEDRRHKTGLGNKAEINADTLNGPMVQPAVAAIDAAQRLRGAAVENGDADRRNDHDATG